MMETENQTREVQKQILQRFMKPLEVNAEEAEKELVESEKFFKAFRELFDNRLKDNAYHELNVEQSSVSPSSLHKFAKSGSTTVPLSLLCEGENKCIGMMRYEATAATFITRLFLGGDIDAEATAKTDPYTISEIGVQNVFATWIAKSLRQQVDTELPHITTSFPTEIDLNEIKDHDVSVCSFFIVYGPNRCRFEIALSDHLITGQSVADGKFASHLDAPEQVSNSPLEASVRLKAKPSTLRTIKNLKVGDCLSLSDSNRLMGQFVVNDKEIYEGEIGKSAGRYSFKVARSVQKKAENK